MLVKEGEPEGWGDMPGLQHASLQLTCNVLLAAGNHACLEPSTAFNKVIHILHVNSGSSANVMNTRHFDTLIVILVFSLPLTF